MTSDEIRALVDTLGNIGAMLANAHPEDKAEVYRQLGTTLTYEPTSASSTQKPASEPNRGVMGSVRGAIKPVGPPLHSGPTSGSRDSLP